jgi:hypothetical protein
MNELIEKQQFVISKNVEAFIKNSELNQILKINHIKLDINKIKKILRAVYDSYWSLNFSKELMRTIKRGNPYSQGEIINETYRQAIESLKKALSKPKIMKTNKETISRDIEYLQEKIEGGWVGDINYKGNVTSKMTVDQLYQFQAMLIYEHVKPLCSDLKITDSKIQSFISGIFQEQYRRHDLNAGKIKSFLDNKTKLDQSLKTILKNKAQELSIPSPF